ncbi:hypothetical protein [Mycobacterium sp. NPDC050853]|uniref:hypothetical protein n=1 Tax=Mycobacterium sp. NPDC050853 TaxID=3155160 RepID=UPI0033C6A00F
MVTIDSLGEVLPLFGANSNNADDFTKVHATVISPLAKAGAAVLAVDHLPGNADSRQYGPTGTNAKNRAVGGTSVRVTNSRPFVPGQGGAATLELFKDRHGGIRQHLPAPTGSGTKAVIGTYTLPAMTKPATRTTPSPKTARDSQQPNQAATWKRTYSPSWNCTTKKPT